MPTDLSPPINHGIIQVRDRAGIGLPFSKGLMATSILATGVETDVAYKLAAKIEAELRHRGRGEIDADQLVVLATETITRELGDDVADRYRAWRRAKRTGRPIFIALGGAPGVGKSTIATRLAVRLGITRVVTTDTIREVLRTVIPATVLPELHSSTYESPVATTGHEMAMQSFHRQGQAVGAATAAVAVRLAAERRSAIFEGVHLLPGQFLRQFERNSAAPIIIELLLTLKDESLHRGHLTSRMHGEPGRGGNRHLEHFAEIRRLQRTLGEMAQQAEITEYDVANPADLTQHIVDQVVAQVGTKPIPAPSGAA